MASAPKANLLAGSKLIVNNKTDRKAILLMNIDTYLSMFI